MRDTHRSNSAQRQHYTIDRQSFISINPSLLYSGSLSKMQDWRDSPHSHEFLEIIFILDGAGTVALGDTEYSIGQGDLIIYNQGVLHYEHSSATAPMAASFIAFDKIQLQGLPPNCITADLSNCIFSAGESAPVLAQLFHIIMTEISGKDEFYIEIANDASHTLLMYIFRIFNQKHSTVNLPNKDNVLKKALIYIDENFLQDIGLVEISAACFVNKYYLSHLFTEHLGMPIGQYVRGKRMEMAKNLLVQTNLPVFAIAEKCAFNDINYFTRLFKKETTLTPLQYRKSILRMQPPEPV